jgi:glycosyltransferase involved in cell wall biosynthesis
VSQAGSSPSVSDSPAHEARPPEVSIVIPCLNEADTLATCIRKAQRSFRDHDIRGEIIVADNGSMDGSREIALQQGARLVDVEAKGYGAALMGGIAAAAGQFIVMGDADDSYDFSEVPRFLQPLRQGFELVQGCRLPGAGGTIMPGAMPFLHRWLGNPLFSGLARRMFRVPVHDVYCGLRGFTRDLYQRLDLRCTGMEFATEMIIKASLHGARTAEIPITLFPDGRRAHGRHLRTFRDGWRTMRFFLIYSPRWLFLIPGALFVLLGLIGYAIAMPGLTLQGLTFDAHTLLFSSLFILLGYQSCLFSLLAKTFAISAGLLPDDPAIRRFYEVITLERGLVLGVATLLFGGALLGAAVNDWRLAGFGNLSYAHTMRFVIPGATLAALGFQTVLSSWFASLIRMNRR